MNFYSFKKAGLKSGYLFDVIKLNNSKIFLFLDLKIFFFWKMSGKFTVEILNAKSLKPVVTLNLNTDANVLDVKRAIYAQSNFYYYFYH